jgi:hypothetical protein
MKAIIAAAAVATAIASPAFAQPFDPEHGTGNSVAPRRHATTAPGAVSPFAWAPSGRRAKTSSVPLGRGLAEFGDSKDHLLPGKTEEPGPP